MRNFNITLTALFVLFLSGCAIRSGGMQDSEWVDVVLSPYHRTDATMHFSLLPKDGSGRVRISVLSGGIARIYMARAGEAFASADGASLEARLKSVNRWTGRVVITVERRAYYSAR